MAHSGKSIYFAKEFLNRYGEDFTEEDLEEYKRISPLDGYGEIGWNGFLDALNSIMIGFDLNTKYKPAWVPDEESARKVADLYGFKRKGHVVDPGVYEGLDKYPNGKTTRAAFFRLMGYPDRHGKTYIYSNPRNDKHISIVYNSKEGKAVRDGIGTYYYSKPYFVFEKKNMAFSGEEIEDDLFFSTGKFSSSTEGVYKQLAIEEEPYREKCWLLKAEIDSLDSEISELEIESGYFNPIKAHDHNPSADQKYFRIREEISRLIKEKEELEEDYKKALAEWKAFRESKGLDTSSFEAYAVIKTEAPYGAKSFTVVGDKATASRITKLKNKTLEDDSKHTYIYRKMDEVNSEKYNIPVNEGVNNMGIVERLLALGGEPIREEAKEEMYGFEAMAKEGLEGFTAALAKKLDEEGSIQVIDSLISYGELGTDFEDQLNLIKNTTDLSDTKEVLDQIVDAAETLLDDIQIVGVTEYLEQEVLEDEEFNEEELGEYEEPEDWSKVDEIPGEEPVELEEGEIEVEPTDEGNAESGEAGLDNEDEIPEEDEI